MTLKRELYKGEIYNRNDNWDTQTVMDTPCEE